MEQVDSIEALMDPGEATDFFEVADLEPFNPGARTSYDRDNVLWLMEFSRLIYRQESDEKERPPDYPTRNQFLNGHGWNEDEFFNVKSTQAGWFRNPTMKCAAFVFRGTLGLADTVTDLEFPLVDWDGAGRVHVGFKRALEDVWDQLKPRITASQVPVFFTGHSLGAALATLAAAKSLQDPDIKGAQPAAVYTYGSPRVGNADFVKSFGNLFHCRVVNEEDVVSTVPPAILGGLTPYAHAGRMHRIEHDGRLHIYPPGADTPEPPRSLPEALGFLVSMNATFKRVKNGEIEIPEFLRDHTPVNYTARLEKAG